MCPSVRQPNRGFRPHRLVTVSAVGLTAVTALLEDGLSVGAALNSLLCLSLDPAVLGWCAEQGWAIFTRNAHRPSVLTGRSNDVETSATRREQAGIPPVARTWTVDYGSAVQEKRHGHGHQAD